MSDVYELQEEVEHLKEALRDNTKVLVLDKQEIAALKSDVKELFHTVKAISISHTNQSMAFHTLMRYLDPDKSYIKKILYKLWPAYRREMDKLKKVF